MGAQSKERKGSNFGAQRSGAIVQKPESQTLRSKNLAIAIWQPCLVVEDVLLGALQVVGLLQRRAHSLELGGVEDVAGGEELGPPAELNLVPGKIRLQGDHRELTLGFVKLG